MKPVSALQTIVWTAVLLSSLLHGATWAQEAISLRRAYTVEPSPNYARYAEDMVSRALTDGVTSAGAPWTASGGLGWKDSRRIAVTLDLGESLPIGEIVLQSARRATSGVSFPRHAFVYLSNDRLLYSYAG